MKLIYLFLLNVLCRPGVIYEYDGSITVLEGDKKEYYYYEIDYPDETYLYVSAKNDSVWFSVSGNEVYYELDKKSNEEFDFK